MTVFQNLKEKLGLLLLALLLSHQPGIADQYALPTTSNSHFAIMPFAKNDVHHYVGCYGYLSSIIFDNNERILSIKMGDSTGWQLMVEGNRLWIKPIAQDADTNAVITTTILNSSNSENERIYHFNLHAIEVASNDDENIFYEVQMVYPSISNNKTRTEFGIKESPRLNADSSPTLSEGPVEWASIPDIAKDSSKFNFNYIMFGSENIMPTLVFDDGKFTYFKFGDKYKADIKYDDLVPGQKLIADIAAAFGIDSSGHEFMLNRKFVRNYLVIESIESAFSLINGDDRVCIFNLSLPYDFAKVKRLRKLGLLD